MSSVSLQVILSLFLELRPDGSSKALIHSGRTFSYTASFRSNSQEQRTINEVGLEQFASESWYHKKKKNPCC